MIGTYAAVLAIIVAALAIGQAAIALCGGRRWSWLSPAVGLALLAAACWGTVRLPGHGAVSAVLVLVLTAAAAVFLRGRVEGAGEALRAGLPVALLALAAASLPFVVEGRFGILGTGFNPDMSQHLLAADRLAHGAGSQLLSQGYPLGPHAIVVALGKGLGIGLVQGFGGLAVAVAVLAPLTALAAFHDLPPARRTAGALLVGLPYMVASYFAQGAFKETMQALFALAFALALRESSRNPAWRSLPLRFVPAAVIAVGTVYTYSFPGLIWLAGTAVIWALAEYAWPRLVSPAGGAGVGGSAEERRPVFRPTDSASTDSSAGEKPSDGADPPATATGPAGLRASSLALIVFAVGALPELGRMIDFRRFETFAPHGPGLGNLFGQISPFEALGIWPSGDFRLAPGNGAVPAIVFYLGAACAAALLLYGLSRCLRGRETAIVAGLLASAAVYAAARVGGTPYTAAKAIEIAAPLATLVVLLPLLGFQSVGRGRGASRWRRFRGTASRLDMGTSRFRGTALAGLPAAASYVLVAAYALAAGGCSLLALANAPVGPTSYSPALTELRPLLTSGSTLVLAPPKLLEEEHGVPYISWELRGERVCIKAEGAAGSRRPRAARPNGAPRPGIRFVITEGATGQPPFAAVRLRHHAGPYLLWERTGPVRGRSPCPLIAVRQARQGRG
ncbi:MAG TPA: hypothetical protein VF770_07000 [Solirubrobacterales bacterium]